MRLLQKLQISLEAILAFPLLDFVLHACQITAHFKALAVVRPHIVVRLAFEELDAFGFQTRSKIKESFMEELRHQ